VAEFVVGRPVETAEPVVTVDAGLPVGRHIFTLVVEDDEGIESAPARVVVEVTPA
jgi:hypothetical protein